MRTSAVSGQSSATPPTRARSRGVRPRAAGVEEQPEKDGRMRGASAPQDAPLDPFEALLALCRRYMPASDLDPIRAAYATAAQAHAGVCRKSGEPYIEHPLAVARILAELAMDARGIAAALLHDTVEDTDLELDILRAAFGPEIAAIVDGVTKFRAVESAEGEQSPRVAVAPPAPQGPKELKAREHAETIHKLFLAMLRDPRVVLLKLADRLHNMRTMDAMLPRQREVKSREVLDIYAPLAGRIGLYIIKGELEDLAFRHLYPDECGRVTGLLRAEMERRVEWAERMRERMVHELGASGIRAAVNWRVKRPYRAWIEAQESGMRVGALNDLIAFRVILPTVGDCYRAFGLIHQLWMPHERSRDYIATAKSNGYQSLHTAVFALDGRLAQVHIRTHQMHRAAQHGVAAHWLERAAAGEAIPQGDALARAMPVWVGQLGSWENDLKLSASDFLDAIRDEMLDADQVFVFTPRGDVHELPAGATVLDLAYRIHTRIGDRATGALIQTTGRDGAIEAHEVGIDYALRTGDVVHVATDPRSRPQPEWRRIAVTRYAREKIARALRLLDRAPPGPERPDPTGPRPEPAAESEPELPPPLRHPSGKPADVRLARCCYPCPGDEIAGLADLAGGRAVTVHRACCRTLRRIVARRAAAGEPGAMPLPVGWDELGPIPYRLHLEIFGQDHRGLMYEVSGSVAALGLSVASSVARANPDRFKAAIVLILEMPPGVRRDMVLRRLRAVPGVTMVERSLAKGCDGARASNVSFMTPHP